MYVALPSFSHNQARVSMKCSHRKDLFLPRMTLVHTYWLLELTALRRIYLVEEAVWAEWSSQNTPLKILLL